MLPEAEVMRVMKKQKQGLIISLIILVLIKRSDTYLNLLREERLLADAKDLSAYIKKKDNVNHSLNILNSFRKIEGFLLNVFTEEEKTFHIKTLMSKAEEFGC